MISADSSYNLLYHPLTFIGLSFGRRQQKGTQSINCITTLEKRIQRIIKEMQIPISKIYFLSNDLRWTSLIAFEQSATDHGKSDELGSGPNWKK